jgi:hypothetical protein
MTWAPFKGARTTIRGSVGVFYDWVSASTFEQAVRVDGFHQVEVNLLNPSYPDPGALDASPDPTRYVLGPDLRLGRTTRVSAGVTHTFGPRLRTEVLYANLRGERLLRGMNLNAPLNGGRPDPTLGNIIAAVSDARSRQNTVTVSLSAGAPPPPPFGGAQGPRWDWTRTIVNAFYTLGSTRNNTDAAVGPPIGGPIFFDGFGSPGGASVTNPPPTGNLEDDWGPANNDVRQRLSVGVLSQTQSQRGAECHCIVRHALYHQNRR